MLKKTILASSIFLLSGLANAGGGYVGLSLGQTDYDYDGDDAGSSMAIIGGYRVNKNFGVEASYINLGEAEDNGAPVWTREIDGFNFAAVGSIPVNECIDVFGKVGVFKWDATVDQAGFGELYSDDGTDLSFGFGFSANLTNQFGLVFEYQQFALDGADASNISVGARFKL